MNALKTTNKFLQRILCVSIFALIAQSCTFAQTRNAGINGLVTNASGAAVSGTGVQVQNTSQRWHTTNIIATMRKISGLSRRTRGNRPATSCESAECRLI
jgi:hypothetical protein